jgi:N-acetylmuramoyl-L-alanine amidase
VRVAETTPGTTRIVLDLGAAVEVSVSQLSNPNRLMIELRNGAGPAIPTETLPPAAKAPTVIKAETSTSVTPRGKTPWAETPQLQDRTPALGPKVEAAPLPNKPAAAPPLKAAAPSPAKSKPAPSPFSAEAPPAEPAASSAASRVPAHAATPAATPLNAEPPTPAPPPFLPGEFSKAARRSSSGGSTLTRALGLKVGRIVIDAGHGGHDEGTQGPHGLLEKELVLDVATRVGKLVEEHMNAEVIYTRTDDTFVPLEGRTAIANQNKADLFLSIHANSSPIPRIGGVETFYLNFSDSKDALDVAARENASSQKSIFELQDLIQKITLHEKLDESKEFAGRIQASLYAFSARNLPGQKNRGVKKAPFVVLIGAEIPSVLVEIGFLSNSREESLLKKSDYRQKLAEALYRGISKYAESLSHFQLAAY